MLHLTPVDWPMPALGVAEQDTDGGRLHSYRQATCHCALQVLSQGTAASCCDDAGHSHTPDSPELVASLSG